MSNYTKPQTEFIVEEYQAAPYPETVTYLAGRLGKSPKSIIGKLSREGVYKRNTYVTKTGAPPVTKVELVRSIAANLGVEEQKLEGLEKTPKQVLLLLEKVIQQV